MFKLIIAIIRDSDASAVTDALVAAGFRTTRPDEPRPAWRFGRAEVGRRTQLRASERLRHSQSLRVGTSRRGPRTPGASSVGHRPLGARAETRPSAYLAVFKSHVI